MTGEMKGETEERASNCAACGRPLAPDAAFCRGCGAPREAAPKPSPAEGKRRRGLAKTLGLGALIGLVIGGGVVAAMVLLEDESPTPAGVAPGSAATVPEREPSPTASGEASSANRPQGFPSADRAQMTSEIEAVLLAFHEDVVAEGFRDAWSLLSARKRSQTLREDGYAKWARAQASLVPYLSPGGLRVRIEALEGGGVARVRVSGMGWSAPGASCSEWAGLTWVKFEAGTWAYDPGYSTTPQREREWKPRYDQLLGASC
ncbi:MAG TPA: zinc ribbon domain-containing protein [Solirubrobacterales bacterium]|nr:zinc ribbon domain-containing protein [Solirubrobacterales bacterium]